jgi:hypothetical protein
MAGATVLMSFCQDALLLRMAALAGRDGVGDEGVGPMARGAGEIARVKRTVVQSRGVARSIPGLSQIRGIAMTAAAGARRPMRRMTRGAVRRAAPMFDLQIAMTPTA